MSDVPLAERKLKVAAPLAPGEWPCTRATSSAGADSAPRVNNHAQTPRQNDSLSVLLQVEDALPLGIWMGKRGLLVSVSCLAQLFVHEAPAWMVSMVVHMVTLVTMAMVTVSEPVQYKPQHLIVTPPEKKVEKIVDVADKLPTTLDESVVVEKTSLDSKVEQEKKFIDPNNEPEAAPATAAETIESGMHHVAPGDILKFVGGSGGSPFSGRAMARNIKKVEREGGSKSSEQAVSKALKWLANHQLPDGGWSFDLVRCPTCNGQCRNPGTLANARNAATGLALLPFLGTGDTHKVSRKYKSTIHRGLQYLVNRMRVGSHGGALNESGGTMYSHGIAAIAICEAYAMSKDPDLLTPTRAVLGYICYAQDPIGGGWRYNPRQKGDTSVVGWQLMALKSGYMAGFDIPPLVVERTSLFLDGVQRNGGAAYGYTTPGQGEATTAIGLLCRMYLGWKRDNPAMERGVRMLSKRGPSPSNMYYNYYATQVMRHWEGEPWENWNRQMRDQLVHSQAKQGHEEGSWFTGDGDLGAPTGGRLYCTAMATMILEVYYRYMPIYRAESVEQDFPD
ncbi:MAG: terpene cyclase/mutase family protein [Planctomycetes bacterium]|nr:terpene cyclase/mutase family protein [Planctomycetota bacterium]MCG2684606.1 terpene cyclase/mutase family protein [Planctomycetales bacterium]